jgi:hypothetical protein
MKRDLRRDPPLPRLVFGLIILAAGLIFWLDNIGRIDAHDYLEWWPLAPIALGLAHLPHRKWVGAAWWLLVGTYFLLPLLGLPRVGLGRILGLWPLLISAAGATLIVHSLRHHQYSFSAPAVMAGNVRKVGGTFKGGEAIAVMGGCDLDFASATVEGEAVLDVLAFWGGIGVRVPRGWNVEWRVTSLLGGYDDKASGASVPGAPRLIIRGTAIMGGIDLRNSKEIES